jgi:hypothetical protein
VVVFACTMKWLTKIAFELHREGASVGVEVAETCHG